MDKRTTLNRVMVVEGCRTPFCRSGTDFRDLTTYDLGRMAVAGLLQRTRVDPAAVELLVMGTVIADPATSNLGREVVLGTHLPVCCPAYTVSAACVSSLQAVIDCARAIQTGAAAVAIAAGAETLSDAPIRFRKPVRKRLIAAQKARGIGARLALLKGLRPHDLLPEPVALAEYSTGETMGEHCERLAKRLGITRSAQDAYALESHHRAHWAASEGLLDRQLVPAWPGNGRPPVRRDNGVRADSTADKLSSLKPAFDRRFGTVTAGNSSFLTDGAAAVLLASEEAVDRLGLVPIAELTTSAIAALDPQEELLLGPAITLPRALQAAQLGIDQVAVIELHEAFAAQVLAVLHLLEDPTWCRDRLGLDGPVGGIDARRINAWGGSLSLGHPFGATGARLVGNCAHRMLIEEADYGVVAACAAGGIGIGLVLKGVRS